MLYTSSQLIKLIPQIVPKIILSFLNKLQSLIVAILTLYELRSCNHFIRSETDHVHSNSLPSFLAPLAIPFCCIVPLFSLFYVLLQKF